MRSPRLLVLVALLSAGCAAPGTVPALSGDSSSLSPSLRPSTAAPSPSGSPACPATGVHVTTGEPDGAMGLRVMGLYLTNCGRATYRVKGHPAVRALAGDRTVLDVRTLRGVTEISGSLPQWDGEPGQVVLRPGERAEAVIVWRNTYDDLSQPSVNAPLLEVAPTAGAGAEVITPQNPLDLGSTGRLGVSYWRKDVP